MVKVTFPRIVRENQKPKLAISVVKKVTLYVYSQKLDPSRPVILAPLQSRDCPQTDTAPASGGNTGNSGNSGQECYKCGKIGHIARNCSSGGASSSFNYGGGGGGSSQKTWWG